MSPGWDPRKSCNSHLRCKKISKFLYSEWRILRFFYINRYDSWFTKHYLEELRIENTNQNMPFTYFIMRFGRQKIPERKTSWNMRNVELNMQQNCEHRSTAISLFQVKGLLELKLVDCWRTKMYYNKRVMDCGWIYLKMERWKIKK